MNTHTDELNDFLQRGSLTMIVDGARWTSSTFGHMFIALLLASVLTREFGHFWPFAWAGCVCSIVIFQATFSSANKNTANQPKEKVHRALSQFTMSSYLLGLCWAGVGLLLFPIQYPELQLFLAFVMGGMALVVVGTQHMYLPACYGAMSFTLPVLGIRYIIEGQYLEATLVLLYTFILIRLAKMLSNFSHRTSILQHERDILLDQLSLHAHDLEEARQSADAANLSKSRFLAQASHDLRQPLHAMGLFIETISDKNLDTQVADVVQRVKQSLGNLSKLFDSLLDITLLDTGKTLPKKTNFSVSEFFAQLAVDYAPLARENGVDLKFASTLVSLYEDPLLLRRMVQNLVANAIHHSLNGRALIGLRRVEGSFAIDVIDNGHGIREVDQKRIFDEFVRLDHNLTQASPNTQPGLGLGLSIVHRIAVMLNLKVGVVSQSNRGSRFRISGLQRAKGSPVVIADSQSLKPDNLLAQAKILVVDDDLEILEATGALLEKWGCSTSLHLHGRDTLQEADLILCDFELENQITGLDVVREYRKKWGEIPAVIISGNSSAEVREIVLKEGLALLHKPVRPAQLRSALLQALTAKV